MHGLAERGLPKMDMTAFTYVSQAALIDVLLLRGKAKAALAAHEALVANPGNAMAHELQKARALVANKQEDDAMRCIAGMLITAEKHRKGYSRVIRLEFIDAATELDRLRRRPDWQSLLDDPALYRRSK